MDKLPLDALETIVSIAVIIFSSVFGKNYHKNHSRKALQQVLNITTEYATGIVIKLAQRGDLTNEAKYKNAFNYVVKKTREEGLKVSAQTIGAKIEEAYQTYKKDGGDIHKFTDDLVDEQVKDIEKVMTTPEARMVQPTQAPVQSQPETDKQANSDNDSKQQEPVNPYNK